MTDFPNRQLHYPDDPQYIWLLISELIRRKCFIRRPSKYHIKHGDVNFFWTTGVITTDDGVRYPEKGQFAFVELIERLYPKTPPHSQANAAFLKPSPLIVSIDLDDEDSKEHRNKPKPDDNEVPW
jgi:hypothetical protein